MFHTKVDKEEYQRAEAADAEERYRGGSALTRPPLRETADIGTIERDQRLR